MNIEKGVEKMTSTEQRELMEQALEETGRYGVQLVEACSKISDDFRGGKDNEGLKTLNQLLEGIGWMSQALHLTYPAQRERKLSINLSELPERLDPLVDALGDRDYGLISDILTFEIQPLLTRWTEELSQGGSRIDQ
jgi:hypothetical protein